MPSVAQTEMLTKLNSAAVTNLLGSIPLLQQLPAGSVQRISEVIKPVQFRKWLMRQRILLLPLYSTASLAVCKDTVQGTHRELEVSLFLP